MANQASPTLPITDEAGRLAALHALELLDSEPEREFEALVALAAEMLGCPTALLSLIDRDRMWVKAAVGSDRRDVPRSAAICDHTIRADRHLVIDDVAMDQRFADYARVQADGVRFYAGAPIHVVDASGLRQPVGVLCVVDIVPRCLPPAGHAALAHIATLAEALLHARRTALDAVVLANTSAKLSAELARKDAIFRKSEEIAQLGSWRLSLIDEHLDWSDGMYRIHGLPHGQKPAVDNAMNHYPPAARARVAAALAETIGTGMPFDFEEDFVNASGEQRRIRLQGERELLNDVPEAINGVFQDVTDRFALETALRRSASTDALTGIGNRAAFDWALNTAITRAAGDGTPLVLFLIDLDGFKAINDTLGHSAGDDVLRAVGRALRADWLKDSCAARLGGDEFAVIVHDAAIAEDPDAFAERLDEALRFPINADALTLHSAGTVGYARLTADCTTIRELVHLADTALYVAKRARVGERRRAEDRREAA